MTEKLKNRLKDCPYEPRCNVQCTGEDYNDCIIIQIALELQKLNFSYDNKIFCLQNKEPPQDVWSLQKLNLERGNQKFPPLRNY